MNYEYILTVFITIFTVVDPIGLIPIYIPIASRFPVKKRKYIVINASLIAFIVSSLFLFGGKYLFKYLEINYNSLYIVGGVLMFLMGLDMIYTKPRRTNTNPEEQEDVMTSIKDVSVFPLAIPMLSGPGLIATLIMFSSRHDTVQNYMVVLAATAVVFSIAALTMTFASGIMRFLGRTGINVFERIMGIILCCLSLQFIINAITSIITAAKT
jgi:multiple antibiotic resistance protein